MYISTEKYFSRAQLQNYILKGLKLGCLNPVMISYAGTCAIKKSFKVHEFDQEIGISCSQALIQFNFIEMILTKRISQM